MARTAILVDGNYYLHRAKRLCGAKPAKARADELHDYCLRHITSHRERKLENGKRSLYRIFYYDCPPLDHGQIMQPWDGHNRTFSKRNPSNVWSSEFQAELAKKRKVAMRMGVVMSRQAHFALKEESQKRLLRKEITVDDLGEGDFTLVGLKQSGVDMRIGLDVASLAQDRIVDQVILIAGDSDFVPVVKVARRAGVDFILDPIGMNVPNELVWQVDGIEDLSSSLR